MNYVDGFLVPVPTAKKAQYIDVAEKSAVLFKEFGALSVVECWEDDVPEGKVTSFPMAIEREEGESVVFSWITWPSKEVRDIGMQKVMDDPRMPSDPDMFPFDGKRMIFGGFVPVVVA